jgi:hypothetical protein
VDVAAGTRAGGAGSLVRLITWPARPPVRHSVGAEVPTLGTGAAQALLAMLLDADASRHNAGAQRDDGPDEDRRLA